MGGRSWSATATSAAVLLFLVLKGESVDISVEPGGETIQSVLNRVKAGDTIYLESGTYSEDLVTMVDGTADARITIRGVGGTDNVIVRGSGDGSRLFEIKHDYYTLQDFTIDGQVWDDDLIGDVDEDNASDAYRDSLLHVGASRDETERSGGYMSALDGLIVTGMVLQNAGAECLRLRHFTTNAVIDGNTIRDCGLFDYQYADDDAGKNGEGIYIGTARAQWADEKNYSRGEDICRGNVVSNNEIETNGNEGVDVKEGCLDTVIENNNISMQHDENAGGISSHADDTTITGNTVTNAAGAGVRVGTSEPDDDGRQYGINNMVMDNILVDCAAYGVKIMSSPQGEICGNEVVLPEGETEDTYDYTGGTYGDNYEPFDECGSSTGVTPPPSSTPAPSAVPNTPSPSLIPGAVYLGCFQDVRRERTMDLAYKARNRLTNEACIEHCREDGKRFAGTTGGRMCRCTDTESDVDMHGESTDCNTECPRDSVLPCGGDWAVTSWEIV